MHSSILLIILSMIYFFPKHPTFITSPSLKDRIHCVAYVFDINSMDNLSPKMMAKLKQIQKEVINCGEFQNIFTLK